ARADTRADTDDAVLVKVGQGPLADIGNVTCELFAAQLGLTNFDVVLLNVNRGEDVFLHEPLIDDNGIFEVVAIEGIERDEHITAQGEFAQVHRSAIRHDLTLLNPLALLDDGLLVETGALIEADELTQDIFVGVVDQDASGIDVGDD